MALTEERIQLLSLTDDLCVLVGSQLKQRRDEPLVQNAGLASPSTLARRGRTAGTPTARVHHDSRRSSPLAGDRACCAGPWKNPMPALLDPKGSPILDHTVYLDTETTGFGSDVRIVEVAIVDDAGAVLLDTLVNPGIPIPSRATAIHGIEDGDVVGKPRLHELRAHIRAAIGGRQVVIYNASYDQRLFPDRLAAAASVHCAMRRFKQLPVAIGPGKGTLAKAAIWAGHSWTGDAHRALADALAARTVWQRLEERRVPIRGPALSCGSTHART